MEYVKIDEIAKQWGISPRRVQALCAGGKIEGAVRFGRDWMIPKTASKPADGRTKAGRSLVNQTMQMPRKTPFLHMTDMYRVPGSADSVAESLADHHEAQVLFEAEIAYSRGDIDRVYESANYLLQKHSGFYAVIGAGMLLALCAIWKGDISMWRRAKVHIAEAPVKNDHDRDIISFSITAVDSVLYNVQNFPDWFKIGCFEPLHRDSMPAAKVFYAKYLYAIGYAVATKEYELDGVKGLSLLSIVPAAIEPMISWAMSDQTVISEIYLRMTCAAVYHNIGNDPQAIQHIDRAISLALPDRLYGILAEYGRSLDGLLEQRLTRIAPDVWDTVRKLYQTYKDGWSKLSGSVRGKTIITTLSPKEREVAKLAAFGMKNAEIAEKLHMSVSGVKQAVAKVSQKAGVEREEFAAIL